MAVAQLRIPKIQKISSSILPHCQDTKYFNPYQGIPCNINTAREGRMIWPSPTITVKHFFVECITIKSVISSCHLKYLQCTSLKRVVDTTGCLSKTTTKYMYSVYLTDCFCPAAVVTILYTYCVVGETDHKSERYRIKE